MEIRFEDISHAYDALPVLEHIELVVPDGEIVVLIGPSGCGKSTLLSIAGGLVAPSRGRVTLTGSAPAHCLNPLTFVFQDFALLPWRTVEGNVSLVLESRGLAAPDLKARIDDVLARTGLLDFRAAYPKQLSGGMRQRVGIARALAVDPAILLLDEPLSALDAQTRDLLMDDFLALWLSTQVTALYVTHNLHEAVRLANRVVVMSRRPGRILEVVPVAIEHRDRARPDAQSALTAIHDQLWSLIRNDAVAADRELIDV